MRVGFDFLKDKTYALIDHILFSQDFKFIKDSEGKIERGFVWNPHQYKKEIKRRVENIDVVDDPDGFLENLDKASDHHPVTVEVKIE